MRLIGCPTAKRFIGRLLCGGVAVMQSLPPSAPPRPLNPLKKRLTHTYMFIISGGRRGQVTENKETQRLAEQEMRDRHVSSLLSLFLRFSPCFLSSLLVSSPLSLFPLLSPCFLPSLLVSSVLSLFPLFSPCFLPSLLVSSLLSLFPTLSTCFLCSLLVSSPLLFPCTEPELDLLRYNEH